MVASRVVTNENPTSRCRRLPSMPLAEEFRGLPADATEENIQARSRSADGVSQQAPLDRADDRNKSEIGGGHATLYGDMAALRVLQGTSRQRRWSTGLPLPEQPRRVNSERILTRGRPRSAAEPAGQDSLPPYDILDASSRPTSSRTAARRDSRDGLPPEHVRKVVHLIKISEYKRRQSAVGIRITPRGFGKDWRYPITSAGESNDASAPL